MERWPRAWRRRSGPSPSPRRTRSGHLALRKAAAAGREGRVFPVDALVTRSARALPPTAVTSKMGPAAVLVNAAGGDDPRVTVTPRKFL